MKRSLSLFALISIIGLMGMFQGCKKATVPELTTVDVTDVALTTAVSGGTIVTDGGEEITEKGVCWSTTSNPTVADTRTKDGKGSANFTSNIVGLEQGTTYYVRAYATNSVGTAYGNEVSFTTGKVSAATIITTQASDITSTTATAGGEVTNDGSGTITEKGVCWSTSPTPTVPGANKAVSGGSGTGTFTINMTGLEDGTVYYYRAYAINSAGTSYGQEYRFITPVTDIDGNVYKTVKIGDQVWMAENLKTKTYNDNDDIPNITDNAEWGQLRSGAYCWANNNEAVNKPLYGALYNWHAVATGKLCPTGWHVPTDEEYQTLEMSLGMTQAVAEEEKWRGTDEGSKLKSNSGWVSDGNGTNSSGFTAVPAGYRYYGDGTTKGIGEITYFWTATPRFTDLGVYRCLDKDHDNINRDATHREAGKSVRCVKD